MSRSSKARGVRAVSALMLVFGIALLTAGAVAASDGRGTNSATAADDVVALATQNVPLNNNTAPAGECPANADPSKTYFHFIIAPDNGTFTIETITLNLGSGGPFVFTGAQIIPNGSQTDNVFVAVPAGKSVDRPADCGLVGRRFPRHAGTVEFHAQPCLRGHHHDGTDDRGPPTTTTAAPTTTTVAPTTTTAAPTTTTAAPTTTTVAPTTTTVVPTTTSQVSPTSVVVVDDDDNPAHRSGRRRRDVAAPTRRTGVHRAERSDGMARTDRCVARCRRYRARGVRTTEVRLSRTSSDNARVGR